MELDDESATALNAAEHLCRIRNDRPQVRLQASTSITPEVLRDWLELAERADIEELELLTSGEGQADARQRHEVLQLLAPLARRAPWRRPRLIAGPNLLSEIQRVGASEESAPRRQGQDQRHARQTTPKKSLKGLRFPDQRPRFSVVIPTHQGSRPWLGECLDAVARLTGPAPEVIVVIDGPAPEISALIRTHLPAARQLRLANNRGFAHAANAGLRSARGELVALLNDDTKVESGWLDAMELAARTHLDAGSFASRVLQLENPEVIDSAGHGLCRWGEAFEIGAGARDGSSFDRDRWVFGAPASACVYRQELLADCGGFDGNMEAYLEDVELSLRAQLLGYPCLYVANARALHRGSSSYGTRVTQRAHLLARNRIRLLLRSMPQETLRSSSGAIAASVLAGLGKQLLSGPAPLAAALGTIAGIQDAEVTLAERAQALGRRRVDEEWMRAVLRNSEDRLLELTQHPEAGHLRRSRATLTRSLRTLVDHNERRMVR